MHATQEHHTALKWTRTQYDNCTILHSDNYMIRQLYVPVSEGEWELYQWNRYYATCETAQDAIELAEELEMFS